MSDSAPPPDPSPLRSVHTAGLAAFLHGAGASVAVTTYQAGKLVLLRPEPGAAGRGPVLNTHFRGFGKPMGFAWEPGRFAVGTRAEVREFHDVPAVCPSLDTPADAARHDAAFLPRRTHVTGDIQVHEMAWAGGGGGLTELWIVNTRFSCLATLGAGVYSFVPRWKPPFVTALAAEDRCHLNGLGVRDGRVRYVTALGRTDRPGGWRGDKRAGGVVMDVPSGEVICSGLSMPHSPRWHQGKLWVLESGNGSLGVVDPAEGKYREVCRLPGFTRGLDFIGPLALVGLSQVRESAVFGGVAVAELPEAERACGVWAVDTASGRVAGFVKFTDAVREVFAVQALPGLRRPDVLHEDESRVADTFELPDEAMKLVPGGGRTPR